MTLSEKITYCRKKAMLSQEALAEKLGVSRQAVSKWETGESVPELGKMAALAKALNTSVDWLLSPDDPIPDPEPAPQEKTSGSYPGWIEKMPGFFKRAFYRWGWLYGVYIAISGGVFAGFGLLMKAVSSAFLGGVQQSMGGFFTGFDQFATLDGFQVINPVATMTSPMDMIANFVIGIGVLILAAGIVLAVVLRRCGKKYQSDT